MTTPWRVERHLGSATSFHQRDLPDPVRRAIWWFEVTGPAVALGSTQRAEVIDAPAALAAGIEVVRRRSGGGAVWLAPGDVTWIDVVLPHGDHHWDDDVSRAATWLGEAWVAALAAVGVAGAEPHRGPLVRTRWSGLVCFAGLAPGEVVVDGRKVVGISQRRTRRGARFQCAVLQRWDPGPLLAVLDLGETVRAEAARDLAGAGLGLDGVDPAALVAALHLALTAAG